MGGQQKNFISDIVFFQHQDAMRKKVRRHFLQCNLLLHDVPSLVLPRKMENISRGPTFDILPLAAQRGRCRESQLEDYRARIFKRLWSPGINSKELIPPAYVAWRAGTITLFLLGA
jgi:hypothetical protein